MNKVYFIAPLLLLVVFSGFFAVHRSGLKAREAAQMAKVEAARQAKLDAEQAARKAAMADAIAAAEQRKKDKAAKEAQDKLDKEARQEAQAEKAFQEAFVTKAQANVQALQTLLVQLNTPPPAPVPAAK
jgi:cell division protein FtsX